MTPRAPASAKKAPQQEPAPPAGTRDRILDVALDLFIEQGFDKTSLREIAEQLGFSKAAIYYHFTSKEDILLALHMRLHELGHHALEGLGDKPTPDELRKLLHELINEMLANRRLFLMHERNRAAFEHLHRKDHEAEHEDIEDRIRKLLSEKSLPLRFRVRLACAVGATMTGLLLTGEAVGDLLPEQLGEYLREAVSDLLS